MIFSRTILVLSLLMTVPTIGDEQSVSDIEGLWELVEWHHEGVVLTRPAIGGRFSLQNDTILFLVHRESEGESEYLYGYGSYSIAGDQYRYGYEKFVEVTEHGDDRQSWTGPVEASTYVATRVGTKLMILDTTNGTSGLVLEGERLIWMEDSRPLRVYERVWNDA